MVRSIPALVFACSIMGCQSGMNVNKFAPALGPAGVLAKLRVKESLLVGELLEVREDGLLILHEQTVSLVFCPAIRSGSFRQMSIEIEDGEGLDEEDREQLRLVSRFPQGVAPELMDSLLSAYEQPELKVWR